MRILFKYWYVILIAVLLSAAAAISMLYFRQSEWMPPPVDPLAEARAKSPIANMSENYITWNFEIVKLEELREKLAAERAAIEKERQELESFQAQVEIEHAEIIELRKEIEELQQSVDEEFATIKASEENNLKRLAAVYTEMKAAPVVKLFNEMDLELVVKIMSVMAPEASASILEEMAQSRDDREVVKNAVTITEKLRKIRE